MATDASQAQANGRPRSRDSHILDLLYQLQASQDRIEAAVITNFDGIRRDLRSHGREATASDSFEEAAEYVARYRASQARCEALAASAPSSMPLAASDEGVAGEEAWFEPVVQARSSSKVRLSPPQPLASALPERAPSPRESRGVSKESSFLGLLTPRPLVPVSADPVIRETSASSAAATSDTPDDRRMESHQTVVSLVKGWPESLRQRLGPTHEDIIKIAERGGKVTISRSGLEDALRAGTPEKRHACLTRCLNPLIMDPNSKRRAVFDVASLFVLLYDLTVTPYVIAFDQPFNRVLNTLAWFTLSFWFIDLIMSFLTGFVREGVVTTDLTRIAKRYLATWFPIDAVVVATDLVSLCLLAASSQQGGGSSALRILRFAKLGRLLRVMGLLRVAKFMRMAEEFMLQNFSDSARLWCGLVAILCGTLWMNHLVTCCWYSVGRMAPTDTGYRWVDVQYFENVDLDFVESSYFYQYMTALHWSVATLTMGSNEIIACNSAERLFTIVMLFLGLLFSTTIVSSLSANMVDVQMQNKERRKKLQAMRKYLNDNFVDRAVARLVHMQVTERLGKKRSLTEQDVEALGLLSASVRASLRAEVCRPSLIEHPLFRLWYNMNLDTTQRLCLSAISYSYNSAQDELFLQGHEASCASLLVSGTVAYIQEPAFAFVDERTRSDVESGQWLAEAALWSRWTHVGNAEATSECQVLQVDADALMETLKMRSMICYVTVEYGKQFYKRLVAAHPPDIPWPDDLQVPFTDYGDLVSAMHTRAQVAIGENALSVGDGRPLGWGRNKTSPLELLRGEVMKGKSTVTVNGKGDIERIVTVIALHISREDSKEILVQIAKKKGDRFEPSCQLPGGKHLRNETMTGRTAHVWLAARLTPLADSVEAKRLEEKVEIKESKEYGVHTKYLRTICYCELVDSLHWFSGPNAVQVPISPAACGRKQVDLVSPISALGGASPAGRLSLCRVPKQRLELVVFTHADSQNDEEKLYAWISPEEFDLLSSAAGDEELRSWVTHLSAHEASIRSLEDLAHCSTIPKDEGFDAIAGQHAEIISTPTPGLLPAQGSVERAEASADMDRVAARRNDLFLCL